MKYQNPCSIFKIAIKSYRDSPCAYHYMAWMAKAIHENKDFDTKSTL